MSSANRDGSCIVHCNCGRRGIGDASTLKEFGWASFSFPVAKRVSWLCPACAGRRVDLTTTLRAPWFRAA